MTVDFPYLQRLVLEMSGNLLEADKAYLAEARLAGLATRQGHRDVGGLLQSLRNSPPDARHVEVVEAMTTKETMFFRDPQLFDALREHVLPGCRGLVRMWCMGCATGQEPYSVAMLAAEQFPAMTLHLLASDISRAALATAEAGAYTEFEMGRGLAAERRERWFTGSDGGWLLDAALRRRVTWARVNLVDPLPDVGTFDVVFLRNVLIYLDPVVKRRVLEGVRDRLGAHGLLFLGAPENLMDYPDLFQSVPVGRALGYRPSSTA
ncbi:MAG TPA: protein-glutamate O-methyltransferase CheR [Candidatus Xenobia bacterium]